MALVLITAPETEPVSLVEARLHLRVDASGTPASHPDDSLITAHLLTARQAIDGRDGWLGRALVTQTWELRLDAFPAVIRVPLPPLKKTNGVPVVDSLKYLDTAGVEQTLDDSLYTVGYGEPADVRPAYGESWPSTYGVAEAVRLRFTTGYGAASDVPAPIKAAMLLHVGALYRNREGGIGNDPAYMALLMPYRVWGLE